jgi:hypothetical protein
MMRCQSLIFLIFLFLLISGTGGFCFSADAHEYSSQIEFESNIYQKYPKFNSYVVVEPQISMEEIKSEEIKSNELETTRLTVDPQPEPTQDILLDELKRVKEEGLVPKGYSIRFENDTFPPKPKGPYDFEVQLFSSFEVGPLPPMRETRLKMGGIAIADKKIKELLGERYALLKSGWIDLDKEITENFDQRIYRLTFIQYPDNKIVNVYLSSSFEITDIKQEPITVQPSESREEVDLAIDIIRSNPEYKGLISNTIGRGIVADSGSTSRYIYLLFYRDEISRARSPAILEVTVDMTVGKIVSMKKLR